MKLLTPVVRLIVEQAADPVEYDIQTDQRDQIGWELAASRAGWPGAAAAPALWITFLGWHALKRSGETVATDRFEDFQSKVLQAQPLTINGEPIATEEAAEAATADPTNPAPPAGSSSL